MRTKNLVVESALSSDKVVLTEPISKYQELETDLGDDFDEDVGEDVNGNLVNKTKKNPSPSSWRRRIARNNSSGRSKKEKEKAEAKNSEDAKQTETNKKSAKDKNDPARFMGEGVSFKAKLIGILEVSEARGDRMCQDALADLKMAIRAAGEHKQRITINISLDGLRLRDEKTGDCLHHHPVHKISFIAQDMTDSRAFGYIFGSPNTGHRFFGIKTDKAASQVVMSMRDLFQVVFEVKKIEVGLAKQRLGPYHVTGSTTTLASTTSTTNSVTFMDALARHLKERENGTAACATASPTVVASKAEQPSEAIADLLDLEFELNNMQQRIQQIDRITPSDPYGPTAFKEDPFDSDPFGDSFTPTKTAPKLPSVACLPPPPSVKDSVRADGTGTTRRERAANRAQQSAASEKSAPPAAVATEPSAPFGPIVLPSAPATAPRAQEEKHWFDQETEALFDETDLTSSSLHHNTNINDGLSRQDQDFNRISPIESGLDQFDVFTELDPLGTGRSKPYVHKKDFFKDLKNPPKKVLKDLVGESDSLATEVPSSLLQASFDTSGSRETGVTQSGALGDVLSALESTSAPPNNPSGNSTSFPNFPASFAEDPFDKTDPFAEDSFSQTVSFSPNTVMQDPFETGFADFSSFPPPTGSSPVPLRESSVGAVGSSSNGSLHGPLRVTLPPEENSTGAGVGVGTRLSPSPPLSCGRQRARMHRLNKQITVGGLVKIPSPKSYVRGRRSQSDAVNRFPAPVDYFPVSGVSPSSPPPDEVSMQQRQSPVGARGTISPSPPTGPDLDGDAGSRLSGSSAELAEIAPEPPPRPTPNAAFSIKPPPLPPKKHHSGTILKPPPRPPYQDDHSHYDHIENYESSSPTPHDSSDVKSPPIPVPARRPRYSEDSAPQRPNKKHGAETDDGYLAPVSLMSQSGKKGQIASSGPSAPTVPAPSAPQSTTSTTTKTSLDITLSQLTKTGFADLASTLGMSPSRLSKMTLQELTKCLASLAEPSNDTPQSNRGSLSKAEYTALRESVDEDAVFTAEFEDNFDSVDLTTKLENTSSHRESLYDKYAVFRELLEQDSGQLSSSSEQPDVAADSKISEAATTVLASVSASIIQTSPMTISIVAQTETASTTSSVGIGVEIGSAGAAPVIQQPSVDRYAALRDISLCDEFSSNKDDDEREDERDVMENEGYAEVEDASDKDDSITEVVRNDEDQDLLTLSAQHSESTESPTLDTTTVRDAPSIMETTILEEDICTLDGDTAETSSETSKLKSALLELSQISLEPVPESSLENSAPLVNGSQPEVEAAPASTATEEAVKSPPKEIAPKTDSWAKFDSSHFEKPAADDVVSPWSSDGKEFCKASAWKDDSDRDQMDEKSRGRRGKVWHEDEESEEGLDDRRGDSWDDGSWKENGWSDRESFDEGPGRGRYPDQRKSRRRKLSPWRRGKSGREEPSPWEGQDRPSEDDFKRAWKSRPKNRGSSWEEERRMRGSWDDEASEYEDMRKRRPSPWSGEDRRSSRESMAWDEDDWHQRRRSDRDHRWRDREEEYRRRWEYGRDRDRERDRYWRKPPSGSTGEWSRQHSHYRDRSHESPWDEEFSEHGDDDSPHSQSRKWRWSRPGSAASRGHDRVSPPSEYKSPHGAPPGSRPDTEEESPYGHSRRRYRDRDRDRESAERRSRSRDDAFSDQEQDYWPPQDRGERTRSRTERDARYEMRSQTLHSRRSNRHRNKTYEHPPFTQKSPFEDDFSSQRFDFVVESKSLSQDSSLEIDTKKMYPQRKKDSLSEAEEMRTSELLPNSPLEIGRGRGSSRGSSRQSPFEDDFTPPDTRTNSARHMSSVSSDVSDVHGSRPGSRPGSGRMRPSADPEHRNGRSTDDVFLPAETTADSNLCGPESIAEPVKSPNRPTEHRRSVRISGDDKNLAGMKARLSNLRRTDSSSSLRKSESINIFGRNCDPFDDDDFFNCEGASTQNRPPNPKQEGGNSRSGSDQYKWTEAFDSYNFEEEQ